MQIACQNLLCDKRSHWKFGAKIVLPRSTLPKDKTKRRYLKRALHKISFRSVYYCKKKQKKPS